MTFNDMVTDVVTATARPDLVATGDISLAIRRATLMLHASAAWPRDLAESIVTFADGTLRNQTLSPSISCERFKAVKYIREFFPTVSITTPAYGTEQYYERREVDSVLDAYRVLDSNIWYLAGNTINLRGRMAVQAVSIGWYQYPNVANSTVYSSWIADVYPFAIIDEAVRAILQSTGYIEQANQFQNICAQHRQFLIENFIDGEMR